MIALVNIACLQQKQIINKTRICVGWIDTIVLMNENLPKFIYNNSVVVITSIASKIFPPRLFEATRSKQSENIDY